MTSVAKNRFILLGALLVAGGALGFVAFSEMGEDLVYYWSPGELISKGDQAVGPTIRLGGMVKKGSIVWNQTHTSLEFQVADGLAEDAKSVRVRSEQIPPQMFREGIGVVVEGTYDKSGVFKTQRLMVNHSNEYRPPAAGESAAEHMKVVEKSAK
ncbi:MAG: cytochrome c maturation protein CcmE [Myxococcota bacterium]